ncbi:SGNH/GDSL hydrolase family protein [Lysobacter korlensis]|uniref:SGNH/GDSL hydrolase family protein n=1 Tax=Lysobacter korlensis TaxID=553636 RepID=A0ABV6RP38_9GAMM
MPEIRYVALGDSFTEGVGDDLPDGRVRGWADLVAQGMAAASPDRVLYANLAIRGRLLDRIIDDQLVHALALEPTLVTFNGGGNDILRPNADTAALFRRYTEVIDRVASAGAQLVLISGGNPTAGLPLGSRIQPKGDMLNELVARLAGERGVPFADNWSDRELAKPAYWSPDRLHLAEVGHHRVAARVLATIGFDHPAFWITESSGTTDSPGLRAELAYYRRHVLPWVQRRLTGRSSGDGRVAKFAEWSEVEAPSR